MWLGSNEAWHSSYAACIALYWVLCTTLYADL